MSKLLRESVLELFGNTPMVRLNAFSGGNGAAVYAKLEWYNPGKSIKDRIALNMINDAEQRRKLIKGSVIIEPTSGNTGLSLALAGRRKRYEVVIVMPNTDNEYLIKVLKGMGAKVILTPAEEGMRGAKEKVVHLCKRNKRYYHPDQFANPSNPEIHRNTTAREIMKSMGNRTIDAFVAGVGTGGTITGVGEALKAKYGHIKIVAVEPSESALLSGGKPGVHYITGIGPGFIPSILNREIIDEVSRVSSETAQKTAGEILAKEGLPVGLSSGASAWAARKVAGKMKKNQNVVTIFADSMSGVS
ncbi:MAG: cysteine synthase A [Candidatus Desulfatibia sp.]|uniref:cysteine synthase A n=1 Tax=Candidatus Desulfatibia sp. TaxID=3101189 RepID=UPI002F2D9DAE